MFNANYCFKLDDNTRIETEGVPVTGRNVVGRSYTEGDYFDGEYVPTYIIEGQTGGFTVRQSDVRSILDLTDNKSK